MSNQLGKLVSEILRKYFGDIVQKVGNDLFIYGMKPIALIVKTTNLPRPQVIESLRTLLKHDLASYQPSKNELVADYKLNADNVLLLIRYPRYILQIKSKYGNETELLIEEILLHGIISSTNLLLTLAKKFKDDKEKNITLLGLKDTFISLATAGYIQQAPAPEVREGCDVPSLVPVATIIPDIDTRALLQAVASGETIEDNIYWKVNFDRFHQDFRDELIIKAMSRLIDDNAGDITRQLLLSASVRSAPWDDVSASVSLLELKDCCRTTAPHVMPHLTQYLKLLEEHGCGFIRHSGDAGGGQYVVCLRVAIEQLTCHVLDHLVNERLGSKAARIFRLIRTKKYIEEEDIQKQAMLPDKECKKLTYLLQQEHFISVRPVRKPASSGTMAKAIYLYHINLHEVARAAAGVALRALQHASARAALERESHARLLHKQRRVRSVVHGMRVRGEPDANVLDIEETITPAEHTLLQDIERRLKQLSQAELELDKVLFILNWYFMYKHK